MLLGLDDTDTRHGGCTTHTALRIAVAIEHHGGVLDTWGLTAPPRLVRLNPAAPHRTRGNGALALPIGPRAPEPDARVTIGRHDGRALTIGRPADTAMSADDQAAAVAALARLVCASLPPPGRGDADPQPGAVFVPRPADPALYAHAVARLVRPADAWRHAPPGTLRLTPGPRRGDIGALAATAWPAERWTWEAIAYRDPDDTSPARRLPAAFETLIAAVPGGFDNLDTGRGRPRAVPRTPCPVRWGIRGTDPHALLDLHERLHPDDHWLVQTNHATGDHARHAGPTPETHATVHGTFQILGDPQRHPGGHLFVQAQDTHGATCTLAAYEPTKALRAALEQTRPGDVLHVIGRTGHDPTTIAIEAFAYRSAPPRIHKVANPRCPCGRAMKSIGAGAGYRCRPCGTRRDATSASLLRLAGPATDLCHQVPDHVRGHLLPPAAGLPVVRDLTSGRTCTIPPVLQPPTTTGTRRGDHGEHKPAVTTTGTSRPPVAT